MLPTVGSPLLWVAFIVGVLFTLALDLGVFNRKAHDVSTREAAFWSTVWVLLSLGFNGLVWHWFGGERALEFLSAYLVEKALSIDNIFVFLIVFGHMGVPTSLMHRVLFAGILGALVLRAAFILAGVALIELFSWTLYVFGGFLLLTGTRLLFSGADEHDPSRNLTLRIARKLFHVTEGYHGTRFFVRSQGLLYATPLFVTLLMIETSDVVFAIDSIPAIFGISRDPFIVFTSNVCAVLGLRAMFFLLQNFLYRFEYLKYGLALVLAFIGAKMILAEGLGHVLAPIHIPIAWSLGVVAGLLLLTAVISMAFPPNVTRHGPNDPIQ